MDEPRPEKVAVVTEVRARLDAAEAAILTEYRGLSVAQLAALRQTLYAAGGEYKIYKNTLVKLAISGGRHEALSPLLQGPTAIAFVSGEITAVAKALRDYARGAPELVIKGGLHGEGVLSPQDLTALADLPSRDVLLAQLAGAIAAPLRQLAGLMQALPRNLAYGLSALVEQSGGVPAEGSAPSGAPEAAEAAAGAEAPAGAEPEAAVEPAESAEASAETEPAGSAESGSAESAESGSAASAESGSAASGDAEAGSGD